MYPRTLPSFSLRAMLAAWLSCLSGPSLAGQGAAAAQDGAGQDAAHMPLADYARLPPCTLSRDGSRLAVEPCRTAPPRQPMPRRPVPLLIQPLPSRAAPVTVTPPPSPPSPPLVLPSRPQPAIACGVNGCFDSNGQFHGAAGGNATIGPSGRLCIRDGVWLQCQ